MPSQGCIAANMHALARYAALVQEAGMVPMVEPEILMEPGDHSIEHCYDATARALKELFIQLDEQGADIEGTILKVSMVLPGKDSKITASHDHVAEQTLRCLKENVPANLAGVVFLSGGQSDENSTIHLDLMNKIGGLPWPLSFSYGRGIQAPALKIWSANMNDVARAQAALVFRAKMNGLAAVGKYSQELEKGKPY
jgi:fructose-bisphosphate aldolase class I